MTVDAPTRYNQTLLRNRHDLLDDPDCIEGPKAEIARPSIPLTVPKLDPLIAISRRDKPPFTASYSIGEMR